jgi:subtilisin family serine protease
MVRWVFIVLFSWLSSLASGSPLRSFLVVTRKPSILRLKDLRPREMADLHWKNSRAFFERHHQLLSGPVENLWIADAFVITTKVESLSQLMADPEVISIHDAHEKIHLIAPFQAKGSNYEIQRAYDYEENLDSIRLPQALARFESQMKSISTVGLLDTGFFPDHPDLRGRLALYRNFSPRATDKPGDTIGHGTHVAGLIAGGSQSGRQIGVAPSTRLVVARIFDQNMDSDLQLILKALQWMVDPKGDGSIKPRAINASWGMTKSYEKLKAETEPLCIAIRNLLQENILTVTAAGNTGTKGSGTINIPGACPEALTVGAVNNFDQLLWFSSTGPATWSDVTVIKPDVMAPGFEIRSATSTYSDYERQSGTSMATPHVTGLISLLTSLNPKLSVLELKEIVQTTTQPLGKNSPNTSFGFGRINVEKALESAQTRF